METAAKAQTVEEEEKDWVDTLSPEEMDILRAMLKEGHDAIEKGEFYSLEEVCQRFGIDYATL